MKSLTKNESGAALVTAILVLMLASGLMAGMFAALLADSRAHATDRDQSVAYAAAHAGLEKLTAGLAALFAVDFSPNAGQIAVVDSTPPAIPGFTYTSPGGVAGSGYDISFKPIPVGQPNAGDPQALADTDITTGPFEGFKGLITKYELTVTARSATGNSEVRLRRELQTVAVPVFQFGIFGEKSLGFHAGPNFDFGGRVHTNESLYLASGGSLTGGSTLTFRDKITAVLQVVRDKISNGQLTSDTNHQGFVSIPRVIGGAASTYRNLLKGETSGLITTPCIAQATTDSRCYTNWKNLSEATYHANIRTAATGAKRLDLPLTTDGVGPIELIKRPATSDENAVNPSLFGQRYFAQASLRILLSDRAADIMNLPTVTQIEQPRRLDNLAGTNPDGYTPQVGPPFRPPVARSAGVFETHNPANGDAYTRVSAVNAGTLNIEFWDGDSWEDGVPSWLTVTSITRADTGVAIPCDQVRPAVDQLRSCTNYAFIADNTIINFTRPDGTVFTGQVDGNHNAYAGTSGTIELENFTTTGQFVASGRSTPLFVGEDPTICTGFTWNQLTGCTSPTAPVATAWAVNDPIYSGATTDVDTPLLNGFIKIERQETQGVWRDVTAELLNYGFAGPNQQGDPCDDPTPNAVIRLMRIRDNGYNTNLCDDGTTGALDYGNSMNATDYWPNMLFDAREAWSRQLPVTDPMRMGGLFGYVALDADNLRQWVAGLGAYAGGTGTQVWNNNGYIIYFSDRRGDHDETNGDVETGEYGHEDFINQANQVWAKNNVLDAGENVNESLADPDDPLSAPTIQMYGETPHALTIPGGANPGAPVANFGFEASQRPWSQLPQRYSGRGRLARPVLFRRALKIINGGLNQLPNGINIVAENPIYIQGNFNATAASVTAEPNVPAAVIGDSITLLSNNFSDSMTFQHPNAQANRPATTTGYRFAMVTGKTIPFPKPGGWGVSELGSDGGVHNFMKMLENWGGQTLRYRGSMVSLYYSRQATGIYRADDNIYGPPSRGYNFDSDFLSPPLLPPGTPMFRDINTLKFRQILRPNQ